MESKTKFYPREKGKLFVCTDKEQLYELYIKKQLPTRECAKILECSQGIIIKRLKKFNILTRNLSESHKGNIPWNKGKKGEGMANYGKHFSEVTKRKIGEAKEGEKNPMWGKHPSRETRKKLSECHSGKKNSNWKNGITPLVNKIRNSFKYRQWRSDVFTRDDFTCQECDRRGIYLEAHHREAFADIMELNDIKTFEQAENCQELWNINNGITLCKDCHDLVKKEIL